MAGPAPDAVGSTVIHDGSLIVTLHLQVPEFGVDGSMIRPRLAPAAATPPVGNVTVYAHTGIEVVVLVVEVVVLVLVLVDVVLVVVLLIVEMLGGRSVFVSETVSNVLKGFGEHVPEAAPPVHDSV
jgi:hypothetical protein